MVLYIWMRNENWLCLANWMGKYLFFGLSYYYESLFLVIHTPKAPNFLKNISFSKLLSLRQNWFCIFELIKNTDFVRPIVLEIPLFFLLSYYYDSLTLVIHKHTKKPCNHQKHLFSRTVKFRMKMVLHIWSDMDTYFAWPIVLAMSLFLVELLL